MTFSGERVEEGRIGVLDGVIEVLLIPLRIGVGGVPFGDPQTHAFTG